MKFITFIKALLFLGIAAILFAYHKQYIELLSAQYAMPPKFAPTAYRVLVVICVTEATRLLILAFYKPQNPSLKRDNFTIGIGHLSKVMYSLLGGVLILSIFNISVKEAITSLSLIAAAIVLMTKDYISNLINGMYLTFARVINIGDQVQIEDHKGKIQDITLTNVHLLNDDDDIIYIPNNKVFASEIINYTRRELKKSNIDFEIETDRVNDVDEFQQEIIQSLGDLNQLIQPGTQNLKVQKIRFEYYQMKFQYILKDPLNKEEDKRVRRQVIRFVAQYIAKHRP